MGSFLSQVPYYLLVALVMVVMFSVLVAAHEYGHYIFARLFNMGVEEFAIGFGKPQLITWMRRRYQIPLKEGEVPFIEHEGPVKFDLESSGRPKEDIQVIDGPDGQILEEVTRFTIRAWPLGGFVRIKGMLPEDDGSETKIAGGFYSKPPWQRLIVLFAGPLFSVLAGIAILTPLYMVEETKPDNKPVIGIIIKDTPAEKAGLLTGDRIKSIDGKPISTFYDVVTIVRVSQDKQLDFEIERKGQPLHIKVTPELEKDKSPVLKPDLSFSEDFKQQAKLGANPTRVTMAFGEALINASTIPFVAIDGLLGVVRHPSTMKETVSGPITITRISAETVKLGIPAILQFAAILSISVGIFNLLPVAPLDGGQIMMALAEMCRRGKRLSIQVQTVVNGVGLMLMCLLIVCVLFIDVGRITGNHDSAKPAPKKASK